MARREGETGRFELLGMLDEVPEPEPGLKPEKGAKAKSEAGTLSLTPHR